MADAPWRCSQCGTINEPVANACRACGRWPSLFELEASSVEDVHTAYADEETEVRFEVERLEPETFEVEEVPVDAGEEEEPQSPADRRRKLLTSLIVPLAFALYLLISLLVNR